MTSFPGALRHIIPGVAIAKTLAILAGASLAVLAALAWPLCSSAADTADDVQGRLAQLPRPWTRPVHLVTLDEYTETLKYWAEKHPGILKVETRAKASNGMPIYLLKITDSQVSDTDKQVALVSSLHGGPERSGTATILHLAEWLLGDDPEAVETRRKQVLLLMPINNPYAYFVSDQFGTPENIEPYATGRGKLWDLGTLSFTARGRAPEVDAYLSVMDQYRPEVHADAHGIGLQEFPRGQTPGRQMYQGQTMFEITGSAYSNYALRPWDWRVIEAMVAAGREAGFGSERMEADGQRLFWGPGMDPLAGKLWHGRPFFYTAHYGYARYHTLITAFEVGWEASGVARLKGLLRLGNRIWEGECVAGYPVNRLQYHMGHFVTAWGRTAEERRRSRAELWQRQPGFLQAALYPQTDGRESYIIALGDDAAGRIASPKGYLEKPRFLAAIKDRPGFRSGAIEAFFNLGPEIYLKLDETKQPGWSNREPIRHGLSLRLRLSYRNPKLVDVRLNGHLLDESPTDGYQRWYGDGYTQLQINIPPEKSAAADLLVVTCGYLPDQQRRYGWEPPTEVTERLRANRHP